MTSDEHDANLDAEIDRELGWDSQRVARLRKAAADPWYVRAGRSGPARALAAVCGAACKVVFFPVFSPSGFVKRFDINGNVVRVRRSWMWRIIDGLMVRVLLTPVILGLFFLLLVWMTTHPKPVLALETPAARGMYFERLTMTCADGQEIQGWLIPPFSADRVVAEGDGVLTRRYPGVVVAHGLGFSHEQYLNLAQQLHQAACTVLMVDTRGQGESPPATITFGVREKLDIAAALSCLRHVSYSDQTRLGVVGYGASGAAALQAAALDPSIGAVVADAVRPSFAEELACNLDNPVLPGRYLACPYEMTFELMVRERLGALNLCPVVAAIHRSTVLVVARMQDANDRAQEDAALLASSAGGAHRVLTCAAGGSDGALAPDDAVRVTEFLCQSLHWTAGERSAAVQELLKARVK